MRVGLVCPYAWDVPGGVQAHVQDLAEELMLLGHEVSVIAPADEDAPVPPYLVPAGRAVPVPYNGSVARVSFGVVSNTRVRRWIRDGGFDVVHVHEPPSPSLSLLACWAVDGPLVATFHTANLRSRAMHAAYSALQPALEKVDARIAVSEDARRTLVEHLGGDAVLIPNGVSVRRFAAAQPLPGWPGDGGALGFLGRFEEPRKGFALVLEAFTRLAAERPGLRLLVAGPGDAEAALAAVPARMRERITMLGMVSDDDKARMLRSVDVYVAPNTGGESFGIILTEAMAAGVPVLASNLDAFTRVLEVPGRPGRAGVVFPVGDVAALTRAAAGLLDDPQRRQRLAAAGRETVRRYDWATVARAVVEVYETVTQNRPRVGEDEPSGPIRSLLARRSR